MTAPRAVGLVVDSGAGMDERLDEGLAVVRLHVVAGSATLDDRANDEVYHLLRRGERATTSTPSPGDYLAAFSALADAGCTAVVCLTIPSRWSGMHGSARVAAEMFDGAGAHPGVDLQVVETSTAAAGFGLVARVADASRRQGAPVAEVLAVIAAACQHVRMYGALASLEFVARSGRVPVLVAGVSDALRVRPVFEMHGGGTARVALARTDGGVLRVLERVARECFPASDPVWVTVFHADNEPMAARLLEGISASCRVHRIETVALAPVIGVHIGPGAVGFAALPWPLPNVLDTA